MTRLLTAFLVAPFAVVPVLAVLFLPWALSRGGAGGLLGILLPAVIAAYPLLLIFGLPIHALLARQHWTRRRDYAVAGAVLGAGPVIGYCLIAMAFEANFSAAQAWRAVLRNAEWGAIGAVVFGSCATAVAITFHAILERRGV